MRTNEIRQAHERYYSALDRFCEPPFVTKTNKAIWGSLEAHGRRLINKTIISTISGTRDTLDDLNTKRVIDFYVSNLYRMPSPDAACLNYEDMMKNAKSTDDYKYLKECEQNWRDLMSRVSPAPIRQTASKKPIVLYYGPVGTSGYASVCRDIVSAIGKTLPVYFDILQFHNYENDALADNAELLARSVRHGNPVYPDVVICHSTPELWPTIRRRHPNALLYGITVWETNRIPHKWELSLQVADIVSTPSKFSTDAFLAAGFKDSFVQTVTHPVVLRRTLSSNIEDGVAIDENARFYCIAENSNRKGILELLLVWRKYVEDTPDGTDRFVLKTSSSVLTEFAHELEGLDRLDLITRRISDADIHKIHVSCQIYVTCAKAEGHGLGACHAVLYGNRVIAIKYGGLKDYVSKCNYIRCTRTEPATLCSRGHVETCALLPACRDFDLITPYSMVWAAPDIDAFVKELKKPLAPPKPHNPAKKRIQKKFSLEARGAAFTKSILTAYKKFLADPSWRERNKYNESILQSAVDPPIELQKDTFFVNDYQPRKVHLWCGDAHVSFIDELRNTIFHNLSSHFDTLDIVRIFDKDADPSTIKHLILLGPHQPPKDLLQYKNIYLVNCAYSDYMIPFISKAKFATFNGMEDAFNAITYNPLSKFEPDILYLMEHDRNAKRKTQRQCLVVSLKDAEDMYETQINVLCKEAQIKDRRLDVVIVSNKKPNNQRDWHYIKPDSPKIVEFLPKALYLWASDKSLVAAGHVHQVPNVRYVRNAYDTLDEDSFMTSIYYRSVKVIDSVRQCLSIIECPGKFQEMFNDEPDSERNRLISLIHNACSGSLPISLLQSWSTPNLWKYALQTS